MIQFGEVVSKSQSPDSEMSQGSDRHRLIGNLKVFILLELDGEFRWLVYLRSIRNNDSLA